MAVNLDGSSVFVPNGSFPGDALFYVNGTSIATAPTPLNQVHTYKVIVDLDYHLTSFFVNNTQYVMNAPISTSCTLYKVRFQVPGNNTAMIDDFSWTTMLRPQISVDSSNLFWSSESGVVYYVQSATNLIANSWTNIIGPVIATGTISVINLPHTGIDTEYYRTESEY